MQFDGRLNTGMYVTDDLIASGMAQKMPSSALSVEVCMCACVHVCMYVNMPFFVLGWQHMSKMHSSAFSMVVRRCVCVFVYTCECVWMCVFGLAYTHM